MTAASVLTAVGLAHSEAAGHFTLPADLVQACARLVAISEAFDSAPTVPVDALIIEAAQDVAAGESYDPAPIATARAAEQAHADKLAVYGYAHDVAERAVGAALHGCVQTVITDHLTSALADTVAAARELSPKFIDRGTSRDALLDAPKTAMTAFDRFARCATRLDAITGARAQLARYDGARPQYDTRDYFAVIRNAEEVRPDILADRIPSADYVPWPSDPVGRLLWLTAPNLELWTPTLAQQDERWLDVFRTRAVEREQANSGHLVTIQGVA